MKHTDPLYRRHFLYDRASARTKRRVAAVLAYIDTHPRASRSTDAGLRRLDDLLGEAGELRSRIAGWPS